MSQQAERDMLVRLRTQGMQVAAATPAMRAALHEIGQRQTQEWAQLDGAEGQQMLERFHAALR